MWLANQTLVKQGRQIHIHLVNNNLAEVCVIESAIKEFGSHPGIKITLVNTDHVDNNFARFVYVAKLRRSIACDQVVFLDDDQYWPEFYLAGLVNDYQPKGMTTWYGKTFARDPNTGFGNYWKAQGRRSDLFSGKTLSFPFTTFKYGGTGGSIWDTKNVWLIESQLLRLTTDLSAWNKIDDLWASYVLDALLGWEIRRTTTFPIDINTFKKFRAFSRIVNKATAKY